MNKFSFKHLPISLFYLHVFLCACITIFLIVSIQLLKVSLRKAASPIPDGRTITDIIVPKLKEKKNTFSIKKPIGGLIETANAAADFDQANGYALMDFNTGEMLMSKNSEEKLPIASLTKLMTAVVALDLAFVTETFIVSPAAAQEVPTNIGINAGEKMTLEELLNAMLLTSANDAAEVLREGIDQKYGSTVFIKAMNDKAKFIGLKNTHFTNPQGFDNPSHYSSADDLAVLSHYAIKNYPSIAKIVQKDYEFIPANSNHSQFDLYNWNGLLGVYPDVLGIKIGNTDNAGYTTAVLSNRGGKKLLAVVLGAGGILQRDEWAAELLDLGYQRTIGLDPVNVTEEQLQAKYATWKYWE